MTELDDWDLSDLLEPVDPPAGGVESLRRRARRRMRAGAMAAMSLVVALVAAGVVLVLPGSRPSHAQRVVVGSSPTTTAHRARTSVGSTTTPPVIPPAPAAAARGSVPFDLGGVRLWLPKSWLDNSQPCYPSVGMTLIPCRGPAKANAVLSLSTDASSPAAPVGARTTTVNGVIAKETQGPPRTWYFPSLDATVTATGPAAIRVAETAQPSPSQVLLDASAKLPSSVPVRWRQITYDGLAFSVPRAWPVVNPANFGCAGLGADGPVVDLGVGGASASCPPVGIGPDNDLLEGVWVQPGADTGTPVTFRATTRSGAQLALSPSGHPPASVVGTVTVDGRASTIILNVGANPAIAWHILGSITAATRAPAQSAP